MAGVGDGWHVADVSCQKCNNRLGQIFQGPGGMTFHTFMNGRRHVLALDGAPYVTASCRRCGDFEIPVAYLRDRVSARKPGKGIRIHPDPPPPPVGCSS
jgi:hypothetical protein